MSVEDNIILTAFAFGSFYLCANTLKEINKNKYSYRDFQFYYNYCIFGFSAGVVTTIIKYTITKKLNKILK
jgi:hypothetical protein